MPAPSTTLLIEGTFRELVDEFANYIDNLKKSQNQSEESASSLKDDVQPLLEKYAQTEEANEAEKTEAAREEVLKAIVQPASSVLHLAPERGRWIVIPLFEHGFSNQEEHYLGTSAA